MGLLRYPDTIAAVGCLLRLYIHPERLALQMGGIAEGTCTTQTKSMRAPAGAALPHAWAVWGLMITVSSGPIRYS
jgi:hypothetical protein